MYVLGFADLKDYIAYMKRHVFFVSFIHELKSLKFMKRLFTNLFYWLDDVLERFSSVIMVVLFCITVFSVTTAVIETKHAKDLQGIIDRHLTREAAEIKANELKRSREEREREWHEREFRRFERMHERRSSNADSTGRKKMTIIEREELLRCMPEMIR